MALNVLQIFGFILGILAWAGIVTTCASANWKINRHEQTLIDNTLRYAGLWVRCKAYVTGHTHCDDYKAFFIDLPELPCPDQYDVCITKLFDFTIPKRFAVCFRNTANFLTSKDVLQICRGLMISSIVVGFVAMIVTVMGLKCVSVGVNNSLMKIRITLMGGILFVTSGILTGAATSYYAHDVVQKYYNPVQAKILPIYRRYEYGYALFVGWASMVVGVLGGAVLSFTSVCILTRAPSPPSPSVHQFRPVSILQKPHKSSHISFQPYRQSIHESLPLQRQVRIENGFVGKKATESTISNNGATRSHPNSATTSAIANSTRAEGHRQRREPSKRSSSSDRLHRTINNDEAPSNIHFSHHKRCSDSPERGLVRSVSGTLKQYL